MSGPNIVRKLLTATFIKASAPRTYDATLSTPTGDRQRDRIPLAGWILPQKVNLLWAHKATELPVGRVRDIRIVGDALRGRLEFPPPGVYEFADTVERLVETGFLGQVSVGFDVVDEPRRNELLGGFDFIGRKELLELSVVNIPANSEATIDGRGVNAVALRKWLDGDDGAVVVELVDDAIDFDAPTFRAAWSEGVRSAVRDVLGSAIRDGVRRATGDPLGDPAARHRRAATDVLDLSEDTVRAEIAGVLPALLRDAIGPEAIGAIVAREVPATILRMRGKVD